MNSKVFVEIFFVRSPAGGRDPHGAAALDKKESEAAGSCKRATRTFPKHFSEKVL